MADQDTHTPGEEQVRRFLVDNPDFLIRNPDLLDQISLSPVTEGDGVIDMQRFVVERLRNRLSEIETDRGEMIENARTNETSLSRIHSAVLTLLSAGSADSLFGMIEQDLPAMLDMDKVVLGFEASLDEEVGSHDGPVHFLKIGSIDAILGYGRTILLREETPKLTALYGKTDRPIRSDALVRLRKIGPHAHCLLAFGSHQDQAFHPGQGTELLSFLARVIEYCLDRWIGDEAANRA